MVISHAHKYVFMQTPKTASTAIASELCESYAGEMILHKHASYAEFLSQANALERQYFSFAGVRNPLDVAVSRYELRKSERGRKVDRTNRMQNQYIENTGASFTQFFTEFMVNRGVDFASIPLNWRSKSFQSVNYIYKYENLQEEFSTILRLAGIAQKRPLPLINKTSGKGHYLEYYDEPTLQFAYTLFQDYLRQWGYDVQEHRLRQLTISQKFRYELNKLRSRYGETGLWSLARRLRQAK